MIRNREIRLPVLLGALLYIAAAVAFGYIWQPAVGWVILGTGVATQAIWLIHTARHYKRLRELSRHLTHVYMGGRTLDIRDNREGELSILKNDIYKVTLALSLKNEELSDEKAFLTATLSDISHQLKTPLTAQMLLGELMLDDQLPPDKRREFTRSILNQTQRMQWLVSALLKLARIDSSTVPFQREAVDLGELVDRALLPLRPLLTDREQALHIDIPHDEVYVDIGWTAEAIANIIKNCAEHNPPGGQLTVHATRTALYSQLSIADQGTGIDPDDLPHIFERFYRGRNAGQDSVGIGLAMARSILEKQNAQIDVTSTPGQGSEFTVRFYRGVV